MCESGEVVKSTYVVGDGWWMMNEDYVQGLINTHETQDAPPSRWQLQRNKSSCPHRALLSLVELP